MAAAKPLITPTDRFGLTLCLAVMAHGILVLGVTFAPEEAPQTRFETMDIILVQQESEASDDAKILAQSNLQGGGDVSKDVTPSTPFTPPFPSEDPDIAMPPPEETPPPAESAAEAPEAITEETPSEIVEQIAVESIEAEERLPDPTDVKPEEPKAIEEVAEQQEPEEKPEDRQVPEKPPVPPTPSAISLMAMNSQKIAALNARIDRKLKNLSERPRKKFISANTKANKYAYYMESWRAKVERVGNLNYPDAARKKRLSGQLRLDVALNQDGSIHKINVTQSSGHKILDDAAIRIVELAAPYAPFPDNIKADTDILHIIRTWRFSDKNRFQGK